jgi:hypothetical protein
VAGNSDICLKRLAHFRRRKLILFGLFIYSYILKLGMRKKFWENKKKKKKKRERVPVLTFFVLSGWRSGAPCQNAP